MLISFRKRFIFVANTKSASTAIETALSPYAQITQRGGPAEKHMPLSGILDTYSSSGVNGDAFLSFGVMRDPVAWIMSWYRYRKGNNVESPLPKDLSFSEFWQRADWNIRRADGRKYLQRDVFCSPSGEVLADVILRYDQLDDDFARLCAGLGITARLARENQSAIQNVDEHISPALLREIRDFYAPDDALIHDLDTLNARGQRKLAQRGR